MKETNGENKMKTKFLVQYETKMGDEDFVEMPHKVPIFSDDAFNARLKFTEVFRACFGDTLDFWILSVDKS